MVRRREGEDEETGADGRDPGYLPGAHALVEDPRPDHEQQHQAHREDRLNHGQGRDQQRRSLEPPTRGHEQRAEQPAPAHEEAGEQRRAQGLLRGGLAGLERLEGDPAVVERGCQYRADDAQPEQAHR